MGDVLELPIGLFGFLDVDATAKIHSPEWKCVYTKFVKKAERDNNYNISDPRTALLGECRIKEREDGYILGDVACVVYMTGCKTWEYFDRAEYDNHDEFHMPK